MKKNRKIQLPLKEKETYKQEELNLLLKHPIVKLTIGAGLVLGALYVSKYFIKASTEMIKACKNFREACRE